MRRRSFAKPTGASARFPPTCWTAASRSPGRTDRKMVINALNSGAKVFMADCEDSLRRPGTTSSQGQINLCDAVRRTIAFANAGRQAVRLNEQTAVLLVRPRGWHLAEKHWLLDGEPIAGAFVDFGLYLFHNARRADGARHRAVFLSAEAGEPPRGAAVGTTCSSTPRAALGIPRGTIKVTVLIETIPAAFEMDEILYELRDYIVGLNCGRWDYIFSFIKKFGHRAGLRAAGPRQVTMTHAFPALVLAAPDPDLPSPRRVRDGRHGGADSDQGRRRRRTSRRSRKVRADKEREAGDGHDGTWVAHPGLVPIATEIFDRLMPAPNQLRDAARGRRGHGADLLQVPQGTITEAGLRSNVGVGDPVPRGVARRQRLRADQQPDGRRRDRRDLARADLAVDRASAAPLDDGRDVTLELLRDEVRVRAGRQSGARSATHAFAAGNYERAAALLDRLTASAGVRDRS